MNVFSVNNLAHKWGWELLPGVRYVISTSLFGELLKDCVDTKLSLIETNSAFDSYEKHYGGQDLTNCRLSIYRQSSFGDNLIITGLVSYLKSRFRNCQIIMYSQPQCREVWRYNDDVTWIGSAPPTFDGLRGGVMPHYHLLYENMMECDRERDQKNCYDMFFENAGFRPESIPEEFKRPKITLGPDDEKAQEEWDKKNHKDYIVYHWNPSGKARMYPEAKARELITKLAKKYKVIIIGDTHGFYESPKLDCKRVVDLVGKMPRWRNLIPILRGARVTIAPDSSVVHLCGALDLPCIGLWGPFHYRDRAQYYRNHHPLQAWSVCPHAPCRAQHAQLPRPYCAQSVGFRDDGYCNAMNSIPIERITEVVSAVFREEHALEPE